ncbi:MAG TPA: hypothetical protein VGN65_03910 [Casimicrobiaceae bacterium]
MHAGIGSAGGDRCDPRTGNFAERSFECILDAASRNLRLPAAKPVAGVLDRESNADQEFVEAPKFYKKIRAASPSTAARFREK